MQITVSVLSERPAALRAGCRTAAQGRKHQRSSRFSGRPVALAWPASRSPSSEGAAAAAQPQASSSSASALLDAPADVSASCPYPRPDGYDTDVSPFGSIDLSFSPATIAAAAASVDELELRSRMSELADDTDAADESDAEDGKPDGMSASLKGMLLLNLGAALFGSNMVRGSAHSTARMSCHVCKTYWIAVFFHHLPGVSFSAAWPGTPPSVQDPNQVLNVACSVHPMVQSADGWADAASGAAAAGVWPG